MDESFDGLLRCRDPVHASVVVLVAPAIRICNKDLSNLLQIEHKKISSPALLHTKGEPSGRTVDSGS